MTVDDWEFEKGEILKNLTLLEDHADRFPCPYCMEKHTAKIEGYAEEIALGSNDKEMSRLAEEAREWRRQIQGLKEEGHQHTHVKLEEENPRTRGFLPHGLTECEKAYAKVRHKLSRCIKKAEIRCCGRHTTDYSTCTCNPVAVCRAAVPCPPS